MHEGPAKVRAATLVMGSQAEYNTPMLGKLSRGKAEMWPSPPGLFAALTSAPTKELFVDNYTPLTCWEAHMGLPREPAAYGAGVPLHVLLSFLRRRLVGSGEAPMERPDVAKEWAAA